MTRVRRVHVSQHQLRRRAGEIIFELSRDKRAPASLRMQFEQLRARASAEYVAHSDRPDASRNARQCDVFDVQPAIEKERQPWSELIDRNSARGEHLRVGKTVR